MQLLPNSTQEQFSGCARSPHTNNTAMAVAAAVPAPLLLQGDSQPPYSVLSSLSRLPWLAARFACRRIHTWLAAPNGQVGKSSGAAFLSGNFAPVSEEVFQANLPLVTAAGLVLPSASSSSKKQAKAVGGARTGTNDDTDDVAQQRDADVAAPTTPTVTPRLYGRSATLPAGLNGAVLRTGPNPALKPLGGYHWFDGDGMIHAVRIRDGTASYCNRWVPTSRLRQEVQAGAAIWLKLGDYIGWRGLALLMLDRVRRAAGLLDTSAGGGTANTALACHAARLLALHEGDLPYALRVTCAGLVECLGRVTVSGPAGRSFTAHPKLCSKTGELHFFNYTFDAAPYITYGVLGPDGDLVKTVPIGPQNMRRPVMAHDFAITQSYAIFLDNPLCFDGERMVKEGKLPFIFRPEEGSRVGLLRRDACDDSSMMWFQLPPHMVFHVANAWEEADGSVKIFVCHQQQISLNLDTRSSGAIPPEEHPRLAVITLDPSVEASAAGGERVGSLRMLTAVPGDFPTINTSYVGRKNRYAYVAKMYTEYGAAVKWDGVAKIDLWADEQQSEAAVGVIQLPSGCHNGETLFVPRHDDPALCKGEDDGWLVSYVHDENVADNTTADSATVNDKVLPAAGSSLAIWDAATMDSTPVAVVALPARVPYGFHGTWLGEADFKAQLGGRPLEATSLP